MITYGRKAQTVNAWQFDFSGLSTDTKPIGEYEGLKIGNGSTFMEIDTKTLYYYDEENSRWV